MNHGIAAQKKPKPLCTYNMILPTNSINFLLRLFNLVVLFFLGYIFINFGLKDPNMEKILFQLKEINFHFKASYLMYFLIATVAFLAITIITSLFKVKKVHIDQVTNTVTFISMFSKRNVQVQEIEQYFETSKANTFKTFHGLLLRLKDNSTIQLADQNLKLLPSFKDYLIEQKIRCGGLRKMKFPFN